eukprot:99625_1
MGTYWKFLTICIIVVSVSYKLCQKPPLSPKASFNVSDWTYFSQTFDVPKLYGISLKCARILLQTPILSSIITTILYKNNHYSEMRDFGSGLDTIPSYLPIRPATDSELQMHRRFSEQYDYKNALKSSESIEAILGPRDDSSAFISIEDIHHAFKTNKTTPYQFAQQSLSAAQTLSSLNGFISLNASDVLQQAKESSARWKSGNILSILDG